MAVRILEMGFRSTTSARRRIFLDSVARNIDTSPSPCQAFVTLEKEMAILGQDLDGLWLYDHDMDDTFCFFGFRNRC